MHLSFITTLFLLLAVANLCLCIVALVHDLDDDDSPRSPKTVKRFVFAPALAGMSQLLYLAFVVVGFFRLIRSYPGNPIEIFGILAGLALSAAAFVMALLADGLKRWAGILSSAVTALLWLLAAVASVAV